MKTYHYILFDLDGTLTDPKLGITTCVQYALHKMGIEEPDLDKLEPFIGPPLMDSFREFYGFDEEQGRQATVYYRERFSVTGLFENEVYLGMERLLAALKTAGKKLAVASSKPQEFVEQILEHFAIREYFSVVVGSCMDGTRVRKEEVVEEALRQLGRAADKGNVSAVPQALDVAGTVMVGDRKFDIEGGKEYGLVTVGVSFGYAGEGELERAGADYVADTVEALGKILMQ